MKTSYSCSTPATESECGNQICLLRQSAEDELRRLEDRSYSEVCWYTSGHFCFVTQQQKNWLIMSHSTLACYRRIVCVGQLL